jgi:hypothetical protein
VVVGGVGRLWLGPRWWGWSAVPPLRRAAGWCGVLGLPWPAGVWLGSWGFAAGAGGGGVGRWLPGGRGRDQTRGEAGVIARDPWWRYGCGDGRGGEGQEDEAKPAVRQA